MFVNIELIVSHVHLHSYSFLLESSFFVQVKVLGKVELYFFVQVEFLRKFQSDSDIVKLRCLELGWVEYHGWLELI